MKRYQIDGITVDVPTEAFPSLAKWIQKEAPQRIRQSAANVVAAARANAPHRTGTLQQGIVLNPSVEKTGSVGKIVLDVWIDPQMNDIFAIRSKGGKRNRYYYPASQEYGFRKRGGEDKVPGKYFMKIAGVESMPAHEEIVSQAVDDMLKEAAGDV